MLLAGLLVGSGYWGWRQLMKPDTLPFRHIDIVTKAAHVTSSRLQRVAWENLRGGFFSLNMNALKQGLLNLPWVADVSLRRHWPDTLIVTVVEQHPVARWGPSAVINDRGKVFYPDLKTIPKTLSLLEGPPGSESEIVNIYQKLRGDSNTLGLGIQSLVVSPRFAYRLLLSNHILVILGRESILPRFNRFVKLYPQLIGQKSDQVLRVDLRYPNGLAIRWKRKVPSP